jgi:polysaccharide export outer membrane protein
MKLKHLQILVFIAIVFNYSCTAYKHVPYYQDLRRDTTLSEKITNFSPLTMQPGDLLGINVTSLNHEADAIYNYNLLQGTGGLDRVEQAAVAGYLVDQDGDINLPIVGRVKVVGYTTKEVSNQLTTKLQTYLSKPMVNVRILNFKISVLGDVKSPGSFNIPNERINLNEALSLAGDLNITAIRNSVLIIRERDGEREYINMNLNSKNIFNSPYYYLKNNDVIYVQPNRAKVAADDPGFQRAGILLSAFSIIVYLIVR